MGISGTTSQPQKMSPVDNELSFLIKSFDELEKEVHSLLIRLERFCRPYAQGPDNPKDPSPDGSIFLKSLVNLTRRLDDLTGMVRGTQGSLDI